MTTEIRVEVARDYRKGERVDFKRTKETFYGDGNVHYLVFWYWMHEKYTFKS